MNRSLRRYFNSHPKKSTLAIFITASLALYLVSPYGYGLLTDTDILSSRGTVVTDPPATFSGLHVDGNQLLDAQDNDVYLVGVNIPHYGANPGGADGICDREGIGGQAPEREFMYTTIRRYGFNTVRRFVNGKLWRDNPSFEGKSYRQHIDQSITWAEEHGLYYEWSLSRWNTEFPFRVIEHVGSLSTWKAFWREIAQRYVGKHPNLMYNICNEPSGGSSNWNREWAQAAVDAIRSVDREHVIIVPGRGASHDLSLFVNAPLSDPGAGVIYEFHTYWKFQSSEMNNDPSYDNIARKIDDNSGQLQKIITMMKNHPVLLGEVGLQGDSAAKTYTNNMLRVCKDNGGAGWLAWVWDGSPAYGGDMLKHDGTWRNVKSDGQWFVDRIQGWLG